MSKREPGPFSLGERVQMSGTVKKVHDGARTEFVEAQLPYKLSYERRKIELPEGIIIGSRTAQPGRTVYDQWGGKRVQARHRRSEAGLDGHVRPAQEAGDVLRSPTRIG